MKSTDDHGRPLTATPEASAWYRKAQQSGDLEATKQALRRAMECDPAFALAFADLSLLAGTGPGPSALGTHAWERHHIEIVRSVQAGDRQRAVALIADHLSILRCDPIATRIVGPEKYGDELPDCHPAAWINDAG
jgi:DNA-binding GntR family transcriptional regulator